MPFIKSGKAAKRLKNSNLKKAMHVEKKFAVATVALTHNGLIDGRMAKQLFTHDTKLYDSYKTVLPGSLLAASYNRLWCQTLNSRDDRNFKYLAILHADIIPDDYWIDTLIAEAELFGADIMSAIVPIKEASGVTSTAISGADNYNPFMRLTQRQINDPAWPQTFDIEALRSLMEGKLGKGLDEKLKFTDEIPQGAKLLVNTGCCVIRVDRSWCQSAYFTINDHIRLENGMLVYQVESEDWFFSRLVAELGGLVMATKRVVTEHIGSVEFSSADKWGDPQDSKSLFNRSNI